MRAIGAKKLIVLKVGCAIDECCAVIARLGGRIVKAIPFVGAVAVDRLSEEAARTVLSHRDVEGLEDDAPVYALGCSGAHDGGSRTGGARSRKAHAKGGPASTSRAGGNGTGRRWREWSLPAWSSPEAAPAGGALPEWSRAGWGLPSDALDRRVSGGRGRGERRAPKAYTPRLPWGVRRIGAPCVWPESMGEGVTVAVVDTGIDRSHPDLRERIVGGYSAVGGDWNDENGHGTHVAGTVAASGVPGGVYGVAPRACLLAVKVLDARGGGSLSSLLDGLAWAAASGACIVNLSLGSPVPSRLVHRAVERLREKGALVVAAAGNSGPADETVGYPAAYPGVVAVGALTRECTVARFSSRGPAVDVVAPGTGILSTWLRGEYRRLDGTSMAAPHVSGAAALLWSFLGDAADVRDALLTTACRLDAWPRTAQGWGALSASGAATWALGGARRTSSPL